MRKILFFVSPVILATIVFFSYQFFFNREIGKGALQVTSVPQSNVFVDGVFIGKTPLCKCEQKDMFPVGDYSLKLVPVEGGFTAFEEKISIKKAVLTVVDRTFGKGSGSSGSLISLSPLSDGSKKELSVLSIPQGADVYIDSVKVGKTPYLSKTISESDHEIKLSKPGFDEKTIRIKITNGYKLTAAVFLSANPFAVASESAKPLDATESAVLTPASLGKVTILDTPNGFLRVRESASVGSTELTRVNTGESFDVVEEVVGWYKIQVSLDVSGWISSDYAQKQ